MLNYNVLPIYARDFLNYVLLNNGQSKNTADSYGYDLKIFFQYLKTEQGINKITEDVLRKLTMKDLNTYLAYMKSNDYSSASIRRMSSTFRKFFDYLLEYEIIDQDITPNLSKIKKGKRKVNALSINDVKHLIKMVRNDSKNEFYSIRNYCILQVFIDCGLRLEELTTLKLKNINFEDCKLDIIGKGDKERTIFFNSETDKALKEWFKIRKAKCNEVFVSEDGNPLAKGTVQKDVKAWLEKAGLDTSVYHTHSLRHTAATLKHEQGVDVATLQEFLGHEDISTTIIYTHVHDKQLKKAADATPSFL